MDWSAVKDFIKPELLILIPVLYIIGNGLKKAVSVKDKHIPIILGVCGIFLALMYLISVTALTNYKDVLAVVFAGVTQGIVVAGESVYCNQIYKQWKKKE